MSDTARIRIDRDYVIGQIDEKCFSSFVEPLGRCVTNGLYEPGHPEADANGFRQDVLRLTRPLRLALNRFPGGNYVSTYRWEDSIGPKDRRPRRADPAWLSIETNQFGVDEFADWSKQNGSGIMMTVNLATRGVLEAMDVLEYCNFDAGTAWSDLRAANGHREPHGIRYWCLSNETDGPWQVGQKTARDYGLLAREAAKGMKLLDRSIQTVLAGSSSPSMPSFPSYDAEALEIAYDQVDYLSVHNYLHNAAGDTPDYVAKPIGTDRYLRSAIATLDHVQARTRSKKQVHLSFDEFNTWHGVTGNERFEIEPWQIAPKLLEDQYTMEDAVTLGGMLLAVLRHADRVKVACISELVNCISHIRTENGGAAWVLPPYYTYLTYSLHGRGESLQTLVLESPVYRSASFEGVPLLDAHATRNGGDLTLFAINRSVDGDLPFEADIRGFEDYRVIEHIVLASANAKDTNTRDDPHHVAPRAIGNAKVEDGIVKAVLAPLSWNVIRLRAPQPEGRTHT